MFRRLYFKARYGSYLHSEHGIKKFAEMAMGQLIRKVTKKSAFYREMNENLLVEKANLRMRADELYEQPMLSAGAFFGVRRQLWLNNFIVAAVMIIAICVFLFSITAFVSAETGANGFLRWFVAAVLATVLAGGGLIVTERLIETLIPRRATPEEFEPHQRTPIAILWAVLLFAIELAILGIVEVRADRLALSQESNVLYYGFILLTMLLPIIAGAIRWHTMGYYSAYKTTRAHRQIDSRLAQIDSILRQNEEYESNFYKVNSISYWDLVNEFKTYKDLYNERLGMVESLSGHFAQTYDAFQAEAYKRYESDLRDITTKSMRRLEMSERSAGSKLGQPAASKLQRAPVPNNAPREEKNGRAGIPETDLYLSPKPIR